jgi:hypothetical protein
LITFPFWMSAPGKPDALITDQGGYSAALGMGYTLGVITPTVPGPGPVSVETPVNPQQPDPLQPSC